VLSRLMLANYWLQSLKPTTSFFAFAHKCKRARAVVQSAVLTGCLVRRATPWPLANPSYRSLRCTSCRPRLTSRELLSFSLASATADSSSPPRVAPVILPAAFGQSQRPSENTLRLPLLL